MEIKVEAGEEIAPLLKDGAVLRLGPGRHRGGLWVRHSVRLIGEPGAVLVGEGRTVLMVDEDDVRVELEGIEIAEGVGEGAGGIALLGYSELWLRNCHLRGNRGQVAGAVFANRGHLFVENCRLEANQGGVGTDLVATGVASVVGSGSDFRGGVTVREGATLKLEKCEVEGKLSARGTTTRAPTLRLDAPLLRKLQNDETLPATIEILP